MEKEQDLDAWKKRLTAVDPDDDEQYSSSLDDDEYRPVFEGAGESSTKIEEILQGYASKPPIPRTQEREYMKKKIIEARDVRADRPPGLVQDPEDIEKIITAQRQERDREKTDEEKEEERRQDAMRKKEEEQLAKDKARLEELAKTLDEEGGEGEKEEEKEKEGEPQEDVTASAGPQPEKEKEEKEEEEEEERKKKRKKIKKGGRKENQTWWSVLS